MSFPLDPALTSPLERGPVDATTGVLLLHGFTGSPWELAPLADSLAERGFFVSVPRLPGHGTIPEDLLWVTWRDWLDAAEQRFRALQRFQRIVVAGLSMGALLGLLLAERHGGRISRLVAMAPAMRLRQPGARLLERLGRRGLTRLLGDWLTKSSVDLADDDARARAPLLPRYPTARLADLFELQRLARRAASKVKTPTLVAAAVHDHVVAFDSVEQLARTLPSAQLLVLQRGFHLLARDLDRARLIAEVADFVDV